jgi:hypothetical protein
MKICPQDKNFEVCRNGKKGPMSGGHSKVKSLKPAEIKIWLKWNHKNP